MRNSKYIMRMSLNVLNHLGLRLYSNIPTVLSEVVANAYDADATKVTINFNGDDEIIIKDNGHGMTLEDLNQKFLYVGYSKRESGDGITPKYNRKVMGRKGIGKLSLFSIANQVDVFTVKKNIKTNQLEKNALRMDRFKIEKEIKKSDKYSPQEIDFDDTLISHGTKIVLSNLKRNINSTSPYLRKRLARRFSVIGPENDFQVYVDNKPITLDDRDFFKKIQFLWTIGDDFNNKFTQDDFVRIEKLNGVIDGTGYEIKGWIGTVDKPSDLNSNDYNNNKISIICRGKMAQEDVADFFTEGGMYADYLIGEIHADFLDIDSEEDIATSNRQKINESDPRYQRLQEKIYSILKQIQKVWTQYRNEIKQKYAIDNAKNVHPSLAKWYDSLKSEKSQSYAKELFATIESFHFEGASDGTHKKKELYIQGIVAFEKLKLRDALVELSRIKSEDDLELSKIFSDLNDLEANLYFDIASSRVDVIKEFQKKLNDNKKEALLQRYLFDNLWLLHPSWERATEGTEIMEKKVETEFGKIDNNLTEEEKKGRMDVKYRTAAGKHIIIELKRYKPTYKITPTMLYDQMNKYRKALIKCLNATGEVNPQVDCIAILGSPFTVEDKTDAEKILNTINGRIIYYDQLIEESLKSYKDYLDKQKEVSNLRKIIDDVIND